MPGATRVPVFSRITPKNNPPANEDSAHPGRLAQDLDCLDNPVNKQNFQESQNFHFHFDFQLIWHIFVFRFTGDRRN